MANTSTHTPPSPAALRVAALSPGVPAAFHLRPGPKELATLAEALGLSTLRKLAFEGEIRAFGTHDWQLSAHLGATVVQPCVVTADPVLTRIDVPVTRRFLSDFTPIDAPEAEMPEDDTTEPLGAWIDPFAVMIEALTLEIPDYPRKDSAALGQLVHTEPGKAAMTDADARPFAGLAALRGILDDDAE